MLEPILEADFKPCSYGFRPGRRVQDAIAEVPFFTSRSYEWVVEGDITACFDEISHVGVLDRLRARIEDKRVLAVVKMFLKAGILSRHGGERHPVMGTPQGRILSPLLSNLALSVLDEHFVAAWESFASDHARRSRRSKGLANYRLVRYADDWLVLVAGDRCHAEALRDEAAAVLSTMGLRLSLEKTRIAHIDEGFDFLRRRRIQRHRKRGVEALARLHLPLKARFGVDQGQGACRHAESNGPVAGRPLRSSEPRAAGLDDALPARRCQSDVQLPARLRLAARGRLAAQEAPSRQVEMAPPPLPARVVADGRREDPVQPQLGTGHPLPIPGRTDPIAVAYDERGDHGIARRHGLAESRMRGNSHVRFGRAGRGNSHPQGRRRAPARLSRVAAWLAVNCSKTAVAQLMRVAWRTVGGICERVCDEAQRDVDLLAGFAPDRHR